MENKTINIRISHILLGILTILLIVSYLAKLDLDTAKPASYEWFGEIKEYPKLDEIIKIEPSDEFPSGGYIVMTGYDKNGSGKLDTDEITSSVSFHKEITITIE